MINVFCTNENGESCTIAIDPQSLVEDMAAIIEVELGVPMLEQVLVTADGTSLQGDKTLESQGIRDDTSIVVIHTAKDFRAAQAQQESSEKKGHSVEARPLPDRETHVPRWQDVGEEHNVQHRDPFLPQERPRQQQAGGEPARAYMSEETQRGHVGALRHQRGVPQSTDHARARIEQLFNQAAGQLSGQPQLQESDPEVQRRIYESIYWENVNENFENAYELMPELFVRVPMLFVNCEVNKVMVKAFIDSGAQRSIMNLRTAEKCGLMRLLDTRAKGIMRGVGVRRTLGVVHMAMINLGGLHIPLSLSIIEDDKMEFIIGLDQLKLHRMIIDLNENCLRIADTRIPFLPDSEVPELATGDEVVDEEFESKEDVKGQQRGSTRPPEASLNTAEEDEGGGQWGRRAKREKETRNSVASTTNVIDAVSAPAQAFGTNRGSANVNKERTIAAVMAYTQMDREGAVALLEAADWNADLAVSIFLGE
ncbi:DNA-damage inducible protein DDI1-like protein, putative [Trypanosoma cruzi marinkellei]|uniref:DNA-damage inducible protein DDI1-like protein, putative n=1 Tax=Trypanosoma cruzi marinkellei TaxID=85056 RepID=K2NEI7_TRYCR|nr:DNA-damage inducible protein DDI1-like protein, putative [Trypanosoma cruzi marinkellei]